MLHEIRHSLKTVGEKETLSKTRHSDQVRWAAKQSTANYFLWTRNEDRGHLLSLYVHIGWISHCAAWLWIRGARLYEQRYILLARTVVKLCKSEERLAQISRDEGSLDHNIQSGPLALYHQSNKSKTINRSKEAPQNINKQRWWGKSFIHYSWSKRFDIGLFRERSCRTPENITAKQQVPSSKINERNFFFSRKRCLKQIQQASLSWVLHLRKRQLHYW